MDIQNKNFTRLLAYFLGFLVFVLGVVLLAFFKTIFIPLVVAFLIAILGQPLINLLTKKVHLPNWVASIVYILLVILLVFALILFITFLVSGVSDKLGSYRANYIELYNNYSVKIKNFATKYDNDKFNFSSIIDSLLPSDPQTELFDDLQTKDLDAKNSSRDQNKFSIFSIFSIKQLVSPIRVVTNSLVSFMKQFVSMILFLLFILLEWPDGKKKIQLIFKNDDILPLFDSINRSIASYFSIKSLISLITALVVVAISAIMRQDFVFLWGFLAFIFNFIPSIGSIIFTLFITFMAGVQFLPLGQWWAVLIIGVLVTATQFIIGNILDPKISGDNLDLSPLAILIFLLICGIIWGVVGMFLSVPILLFLKAVCTYVPSLQPFAVVLGNSKSGLAPVKINFSLKESKLAKIIASKFKRKK